MRSLRTALGATAALLLAVGAVLAPPALAHPDEATTDGPVSGEQLFHDDEQHGAGDGHLPASSKGVSLIGKIDNLTTVDGGISDVAGFGSYAYLGAFHPECTGRNPGSQGGGVHVVDVKDPENPVKVAFIPAHPNSYVGEGVHVFRMATKHFTGDVLVHNNETCDASKPAPSGASMWDVTDPRNPKPLSLHFGDATPKINNQEFHTTHSVQGWSVGGRAFVALQDNQELKDVDIVEVTDPRNPVFLAEQGLEEWPGAYGSYANGETVNHHDMQVQQIGGKWYMAVSYWDAGQVLLDVTDPAKPVFVTDSDYGSPDPETGFQIAEGNSHQSYWSSDGKYLLSTDEDFSSSRTLFRITSGDNASAYSAGSFGWTPPLPEGGLTGTTVYGGSGCEEDVDKNGVSDRAEVPSAEKTGADIVVFTRGTCFFSKKTESGQLAGYKGVIVAQSHGGTRNGLLPDAFICGSQGHAYTPTIPGICIGHRAAHLLFSDEPAYIGPDIAPGGDMPAIGTLGAPVSAKNTFDGWGYVHQHDGLTLAEQDTYAVPEALDPAHASGSGNLTVHEVKTDPRQGKYLAYASWYDAGLRVLKFGPGGITEVGHHIAGGGNDFWGVFPLMQGKAAAATNARPLLLMSDRDSGLWIFRYTGRE
ncbi:MAG: hypothetical protein M3P93_15395 [Actinomycetota bacterium]|nr:hypothetical protein [Actinomycetota bacterium]